MDDLIQDFIAEARREALEMGYSDLGEAVVDMRREVSKMGLLNEVAIIK